MTLRRRRIGPVVLALAVVAAFPACAKQADRTTTKVEGEAQSVTIELVDDAFRPLTVGALGGMPVDLHLKNKGIQHHTFTDDISGIDVELAPGKSETVTVPPLPAGDDRYFLCRFHEGNGMKGKISFVPEL